MENENRKDLERLARLLKWQGIVLMLQGFLLVVASVLTICAAWGV